MSLNCVVWMENWIEEVGESQPNTDGKFHVEALTIKEIYKEYCAAKEAQGEPYLRKSSFYHIWKVCFPDCIIR